MSDISKKPIRSYQDLFRANPNTDEFLQAIHEASGSSDRASALLFAAHVEIALHQVIELDLLNVDASIETELYRQGGLLSSFSSKATFALITGKIDRKTKGELDLIRKVRNVFAHSALPLTFEETAISQICMRLDLNGIEAYIGEKGEKLWEKSWSASKRHFCGVCVGYIRRFLDHFNKENQRKLDEAQRTVDEIKDAMPILDNIKKLIGK